MAQKVPDAMYDQPYTVYNSCPGPGLSRVEDYPITASINVHHTSGYLGGYLLSFLQEFGGI